MSPHSRLALTLGIALVIWIPEALSVLNNQTDLTRGGMYLLGEIALAYVGTGVISHLTENYRHTQNVLARAKREIESLEKRASEDERNDRRRATDSKEEK